jgi:hypothetical protein
MPLLVLAVLLALLLLAPSADAAHIDGVSDQNLRSEWVGGVPTSHIRYARLVIPWDVMAAASGEALHFELLAGWLADVKALGLIPDVAIEQAEAPVALADGELLQRVPGSQASYRRYVSELLSYAASAGESISYLEAWNEPNNAALGPAAVGHPSARTAAEYMNTATVLCAAYRCTPMAGDFLDAEYRWAGHAEVHEGATGMGAAYEREYDSYLDPVNPPIWGFHPYAAVRYETTETVAEFRGALPDPSDSMWFTEVGVYECKGGHRTGLGDGLGEQQGGARYLSRLLDSEFHVAHTFYYELKAPAEEQELACPDGEDTSLFSSTGQARGAARILFGGGTPLARSAIAVTQALSGDESANAEQGAGFLAGSSGNIAGEGWPID